MWSNSQLKNLRRHVDHLCKTCWLIGSASRFLETNVVEILRQPGTMGWNIFWTWNPISIPFVLPLWFFQCVFKSIPLLVCTLCKNENERQRTKQVPIPLPRASRNFLNVKTRNDKKFYNWKSEIIPLICFGKQMDRT